MRLVVAAQEGLYDLQALDGLRALLALAGLDGLAELFGSRLEVDGIEQVADGFRAHAAAEVVAVVRAHLAIERLVGDEHLRFDLEEHVERLGTQVLALLEVVTQVLDLALDLIGRHEIVFVVLALALFVEVLGALVARELDQAVALGVELFELSGQLFLELLCVFLARFLVNPGDDIAREVQDLLQVLRARCRAGSPGATGSP